MLPASFLPEEEAAEDNVNASDRSVKEGVKEGAAIVEPIDEPVMLDAYALSLSAGNSLRSCSTNDAGVVLSGICC